jgi:hypothetical protein
LYKSIIRSTIANGNKDLVRDKVMEMLRDERENGLNDAGTSRICEAHAGGMLSLIAMILAGEPGVSEG